MISDPATARAALADALEIVLPGRVYPQPPTTSRYVTPSIFIEQPELVIEEPAVSAIFPVWIVVDGTVDAQIASLDDLTWNAWLAIAPLADTLRVRPATVTGYRAAVLEASVVVGVAPLCGMAPPQTVTIPASAGRRT